MSQKGETCSMFSGHRVRTRRQSSSIFASLSFLSSREAIDHLAIAQHLLQCADLSRCNGFRPKSLSGCVQRHDAKLPYAGVHQKNVFCSIVSNSAPPCIGYDIELGDCEVGTFARRRPAIHKRQADNLVALPYQLRPAAFFLIPIGVKVGVGTIDAAVLA